MEMRNGKVIATRRGVVSRRTFVRGAAGVGAGILAEGAALALPVPIRDRVPRRPGTTPGVGDPAVRLLAASDGPQFFLDDTQIAAASGVSRIVVPPGRLDQPVITSAVDGAWQPYISALRDAESGRIRVWYNTLAPGDRSHVAYLESPDGLNFRRPHLSLADPGLISVGASVIDEGLNVPDPRARYKMAFDTGSGGMVAVSRDGFGWTPLGTEPLVRSGDIITLIRDPYRGRYVILCKLETDDDRRIVGQSVSADCLTWSTPRVIVAPVGPDHPETEFYGIGGVVARGGLLIGLLRILRDDLPAEAGGEPLGIGYTVLTWSHDGETWWRDRTPFVERSGAPGAWDRAMAWGDAMVDAGDRTLIYYGGYQRGHKISRSTERDIGVGWMTRDRFVARYAERGWLSTPAFVAGPSRLVLNADVRGEMRVAVLGLDGRPLVGFTWDECRPITGDALRHVVAWRGRRLLPDEEAISLQFQLSDASLYTFGLDGCLPDGSASTRGLVQACSLD